MVLYKAFICECIQNHIKVIYVSILSISQSSFAKLYFIKLLFLLDP